MSEIRNLICIGCPMGCPLAVTLEDGGVSKVEGNTCKRGDAYARREVTNPTRILTTTVPVRGGTSPTVAVKTAGEVPKPLLLKCARAVKNLTAEAPVKAGQVVFKNICGTGVDLIAVKDVERGAPEAASKR